MSRGLSDIKKKRRRTYFIFVKQLSYYLLNTQIYLLSFEWDGTSVSLLLPSIASLSFSSEILLIDSFLLTHFIEV